MKRKSTVGWAGVTLAVVAAQAGAQAAADQQEQGSGAETVSTLSPIVVKGQTLQTQLPVGSTVTTRQMLDERAIDSWEDFSKRGEPGVNFNRLNNSVKKIGRASCRERVCQ